MAKKANARRYAQAVFEIALEKRELERWQTDLDKIVGSVSDHTFHAALDSPKIKIEDKIRFLKERLPAINPLALNLLQLLITGSDVGLISPITAEYRRLVNDYHGIASADVVTAVPLDEQDKKTLAGKLGVLVGAEVEIKTTVDPDILGGFVAHVGGKLLDGSTRSKLAALKKELESGR